MSQNNHERLSKMTEPNERLEALQTIVSFLQTNILFRRINEIRGSLKAEYHYLFEIAQLSTPATVAFDQNVSKLIQLFENIPLSRRGPILEAAYSTMSQSLKHAINVTIRKEVMDIEKTMKAGKDNEINARLTLVALNSTNQSKKMLLMSVSQQ